MSAGFDPAAWSLRLEGPGERPLGMLKLDDVRALPRVEQVTELKCIEGWSEIVRWGGARLSDFLAAHARSVPSRAYEYVTLVTPDGGYYVGIERAAALHPQTLLCYEMNGVPLTLAHGAPLRLVTPLKYGVKSLKRIGLIRLTAERLVDYWAKRGYDWYIGH